MYITFILISPLHLWPVDVKLSYVIDIIWIKIKYINYIVNNVSNFD